MYNIHKFLIYAIVYIFSLTFTRNSYDTSYKMPKLDWFALCEKIREIDKAVPIIFITATIFHSISKMVLTSKLTAPTIKLASLTFTIRTGASSCTTLKVFLLQVMFAQSKGSQTYLV